MWPLKHWSSDSDALRFVMEALNGVSHGDRVQYDEILRIVLPHRKMDPNKEMDAHEEALLVALLNALSHAVSRIDPAFHYDLLEIIFKIRIWNYREYTQNSVADFIISLAAAPDKFLDLCLKMLIRNVCPPRIFCKSKWNSRKEHVHFLVHTALLRIAELSPVVVPRKLKEAITNKRIYVYNASKEKIVAFVDFLLRLEGGQLGEYLTSFLVGKIVGLLVDIDANFSLEDMSHEVTNEGIFEMKIEDMEKNSDSAAISKKSPDEARLLVGNSFADKLDALMVVIFEQIKSHAASGHLLTLFESLLESFQQTILKAYQPKFTQFIMFYACSLDPGYCGLKFAHQLEETFFSKSVDLIARRSAVLYLASYLSRAKFISLNLVADILERLVQWCYEHLKIQNGQKISYNVEADSNRLFYSATQAVMYILCFRLRSLMDIPQLWKRLLRMPLESIFCHPLNPLMVCLPTIVEEFLRQANAARIFNTSMCITPFSKAFGEIVRMNDDFFPFDPYLLKESDKFIRPSYVFWYMVKKTYADCDSDDDEEENDDLDIPDFSDNGIDIHGHHDPELDEDDMECAMNKMSITPKPTFEYYFVGSNQIPAKIPARIKP